MVRLGSRVITCARGREMRCVSQAKKALMSTQTTLAVAAAAGFLAIAAFQAALALGAPLGRAAWGGIHARLPVKLRIASAFAVGARDTARRAVEVLRDEGLVVTIPQRGTYVVFRQTVCNREQDIPRPS